MTWTYHGTPGADTADGRRDAVRMLVGDTNDNDRQSTDEEIAFALSEGGDNVYNAAAIIARSLAGLYARRVDVSFDGVRNSFAQRQEHYEKLATRYEREAKLRGAGIGTPVLTGVSESEMDSVEDDADRPDPAFRRRQFRNPPEGESETAAEFHN